MRLSTPPHVGKGVGIPSRSRLRALSLIESSSAVVKRLQVAYYQQLNLHSGPRSFAITIFLQQFQFCPNASKGVTLEKVHTIEPWISLNLDFQIPASHPVPGKNDFALKSILVFL